MVAKKSAKKTSGKKSAKKAGKKLASSAKKALTGKSSTKKSGKKRGSPGLLNKAKKTLKAVFAGAAEGAIVGAAEAGSKATGIAPTDQKQSPAKKASRKK